MVKTSGGIFVIIICLMGGVRRLLQGKGTVW